MASGKDIITNSLGTKFPKATADKKKRKRPSKKVPTTVVEATCTDFMDLVLKLTGSEEDRRGKSVSDPPQGIPPPAKTQQDNPRVSQTYFQDLLRSKTAMIKGDLDGGSLSRGNHYTSTSNFISGTRGLDHHDQQSETIGLYNSYSRFSPTNSRDAEEEHVNWFGSHSDSSKESSRAALNEILSTSSQWRNQAGPSSYRVSMDHMSQMRA